MYSTTVFMGRMQPLHNGHLYCIQTAIDNAACNVVIILGTAKQSPNSDNPLSDKERYGMVINCIKDLPNVFNVSEVFGCLSSITLSTGPNLNLFIHLVRDLPYEGDLWESIVKSLVPKCGTTAQIGCEKVSDIDIKDHHIRTMFKDWGFINVGELTDGYGNVMSSSDIRHFMYTTGGEPNVRGIPEATLNTLRKFITTPQMESLSEEYRYLQEYPTLWGQGPFSAGDSVVIHKDKVLLIERGGMPGKGFLALPGGFKEGDESDVTNALRELYEETNLFVPTSLVMGTHTFNRGKRSKRNIISNTSIVYLPNDYDVSSVKAGDDASNTRWVSISELHRLLLFSDHLDIINYMLKNYKER